MTIIIANYNCQRMTLHPPVFLGGFALLGGPGNLKAVSLEELGVGFGVPLLASSGAVLVLSIGTGILGILGQYKFRCVQKILLIYIRSILCDVCWPLVLHHICWSVLSSGLRPISWSSRLSSLLLFLTQAGI